MWTEILGEDIYRIIDKGYCRLLVEKEEKILRQGIQGELLQLFQSNQLYYKGAISKVNFESFFRFFIQIGIDYIERNNKNRKILYTNRTENLAINIVKAIVKIPKYDKHIIAARGAEPREFLPARYPHDAEEAAKANIAKGSIPDAGSGIFKQTAAPSAAIAAAAKKESNTTNTELIILCFI